MKRVFILLVFIVVFVLGSISAFAYTDAEIDAKLKDLSKGFGESALVHGRAYIYYSDNQLGASNPSFDISRMYLDLNKELDANSSVRFTTDIARESYWTSTNEASTRVFAYLKYAYWQLNDPDIPFTGINSVRLGCSATHWIDFMQKFWRFRYVEKTITDQRSVFSSSDIGLAALGAFSVPLLPKVNYHATLMNGPGYKEAEDNGYKDTALTLKIIPLSWGEKDRVTAAIGLHLDDTGMPGQVTTTNVMAGWQFTSPSDGILFIEYGTSTSNKMMFSMGGDYEVADKTSLFARLDNFDPNTTNSNNKKTLNIFGVEYDHGKNIKIALDYQTGTTNGTENVRSINLHSRVKW